MNISGIYSRYNYALSSKNDTGGGPVNTSGTFTWKSAVENWIFKPDFTYYHGIGAKIRFGLNNTLYPVVGLCKCVCVCVCFEEGRVE